MGVTKHLIGHVTEYARILCCTVYKTLSITLLEYPCPLWISNQIVSYKTPSQFGKNWYLQDKIEKITCRMYVLNLNVVRF